MMNFHTFDIYDCLDKLESIGEHFENEYGNKPTAIAIYDSGLLQVVTRLYELVSEKYDGVEVNEDIYTALEYALLSKRFKKIESDIGFAITETYREGTLQLGINDAFEELIDISDDYPLEKPVVTWTELFDRIQEIKRLTEDTYRVIHFYLTNAMIQIGNILYSTTGEQQILQLIVDGYRRYMTEYMDDDLDRLTRHAEFFRESIRKTVNEDNWESLYKLEKLAYRLVLNNYLDNDGLENAKHELKHALREELSYKKDYEINDIWIELYDGNYVEELVEHHDVVRFLYDSMGDNKLILLDEIRLQDVAGWLTPDNMDWFYEFVNRYNLIQCGVFPDLKERFMAWLGKKVGSRMKEKKTAAKTKNAAKKTGRKAVTLEDCIVSEDKEHVIAEMKTELQKCVDGPAEIEYLFSLVSNNVLKRIPAYEQFERRGMTKVSKTPWNKARSNHEAQKKLKK